MSSQDEFYLNYRRLIIQLLILTDNNVRQEQGA